MDLFADLQAQVHRQLVDEIVEASVVLAVVLQSLPDIHEELVTDIVLLAQFS